MNDTNSETDIRPGTPLDVGKASKRNLVLLHEEHRRLKGLMDQITRSAMIIGSVRSGMEIVLGLDHEWDLDNDYDPDDPPEKREVENPMKRLFGG